MWDNQRNQRICQPADRISSLPDETLCDILSFLSTKSAVKTSVLSKRWKYVWTKVPVLDFTEFLDDSSIYSYNLYHKLTLEQKTLFKSFVDRVLSDNDVSYVQTLRLQLYRDHFLHINSWLHALTKRDIRDIDISLMDIVMVRMRKPIELPITFLCSERLVSLKLEGRFTINFPVPLHLPNLEILRLNCVLLPNGDFFKTFSSSCPVLKDLQIVETVLINTTISVESLTLLRLTISEPAEVPFVIRAPNLRYLYLKVRELIKQNVTFVGELKLLDEVDIDIFSFDDVEDVRELVRTVCMVPTLRFVANRLYEYDINLPIFQNLTSFRIRCEKSMLLLLEHAPNLKILNIEFVDRNLEVVWLESILSKPVPKCIRNLERVQIGGFRQTDVHVQLVSYFLKFASVLKEMKLTLCPNEPSNWEEKALNNTFKKLLALPRTSTTCQITIIDERGFDLKSLSDDLRLVNNILRTCI